MNRSWRQKNRAKKQLAIRRAKLIRNGIRESLNADDLVRDFFAMYLGREGVTSEELRAWAKIHVRTDNKTLREALRDMYAEAYVFGEDIALNSIAKARVNKAPATLQQLRRAVRITNWSTWRAGNRPAALLLRPPRGLADLLDRSNVTIQGINNTTLDRIGTLLSRALAKGLTPKSVQDDIEDLLGDSERAINIAQTEMSRATAVASRELYQDSGVELVEWLVAEPCDICQENADVSPIRIDERFPSGDTEPPAHPNCVCDIAPYVVDTRNIGSDALSMILGDEE